MSLSILLAKVHLDLTLLLLFIVFDILAILYWVLVEALLVLVVGKLLTAFPIAAASPLGSREYFFDSCLYCFCKLEKKVIHIVKKTLFTA